MSLVVVVTVMAVVVPGLHFHKCLVIREENALIKKQKTKGGNGRIKRK